MSERKFLVNRFRIGLVGLVVVALFGLTAGGAVAATGRGTAAASITLLDVALGNVQNIKVLSDEGQGTLDPARLGLPGPRAFGQLTAVNASGVVNQVLPDPPQRAEAPGTTSGSLSVNPIPVSFPPSTSPLGVGGLPIPAGVLASGMVNPVKVEAFLDAAGARSAVGTEVPNLSVLQGLISINNVKVGSVATSATPTASQGDSGVLSIGDITVLDLSSFLGMLPLGLSDLNVAGLTGLVDGLGLPLPVSTGGLAGSTINGASASGVLSSLTGLVSMVDGVTAANDCAGLTSATSTLSTLPLDSVLGSGGLLGFLGLTDILGLDSLLSGCSAGNFLSTQSSALSTITSTIDSILPTADGVLDTVFSTLESAPLIQLSGVELSALASAVETLAGSKAQTSAKLGTLKVGGLSLGALDLNATVEQINSLKNEVESKLDFVTGTLGLGNLIDIAIMERTASTRAEGVYNVADAAVNALRVSINPPANLAGALGGVTNLPVGTVLAGVPNLNLPVDTGLADGVLAQAFGLTSLLSQPTTITVGAIRAQGDFTTVAGATTGVPTSPPVSGELPRTGGSNGAWMAALAALALAGAFGLTRTLRKAPIEG